jgi:serine/threonine protein kinase
MDKYEKKEYLGCGTFGSIHKITNKLNGVDYVVKRVSLGANTKEEREEAYREVQVSEKIIDLPVCWRYPCIPNQIRLVRKYG